jgi:hypothetical protein
MLTKLAALLVAIPLSMLGVFVGTGIAVVDVKEGGPGGHRIVVPVPLLLVQAAASFVPAKHLHGADRGIAEAKPYLPGLSKVVEALAEAPDCELVRVEERKQLVVVAKRGGMLQVTVDGAKEQVRVSVPLAIAADVLQQLEGGRIRPASLVASLQHARFTQLVDVRDGDDHVSVRLY